MSDELLQLIFLLLRGAEKKIETVEGVNGFAFSRGLDGSLARPHRLNRGDEPWEHGRFGYRVIVRTEDEF